MTLLKADTAENDRASQDDQTTDMVWIPGGTLRVRSSNHYPKAPCVFKNRSQ
jgi:hypothetical protein